MAKRKTTKKSTQTSLFSFSAETIDSIIGVILVALSLLVFFATQETAAHGDTPLLGKYLSQIGIILFGEYYRILFAPILFGLWVMLLLKKTYWTPLKLLGIFGFYISSTSLLGWYSHSASEFPAQTGIGFFDIYPLFEGIIGSTTALLFFVVLFFVSLYLVFHISYRKILGRTYAHISQVAQNSIITRNERPETPTKERPSRESSTKTQKIEAELEAIQNKKKRIDAPEKLIESPTTSENTGAKIIGNLFGKGSVQHETKIPVHDKSGKIIESPKIKEDSTPKVSKPISGWDFPSVELLNKPRKANPISPEEIREKALIIQKTLLQFGIEVEMERECVWPTVIQYRLRPAEGVKVAKIENLNKDLALALSAKSIRIQAPIPGMNLVGIEVPNDKRDVITIREVLSDKSFTHNKSKLAVALGKDINGEYIVADLAKMPHLLIAGQTGSGKSVGMNGLILSLLYKNTPAELQMIMVDPKQVELGMYDGIPHLLTPVITSPEKALNALKWAVAEMERRYGILKEKRKKFLDEYNDSVPVAERMPSIIFIIDELADLMMSGNKKEVEYNIARIAQKARAVGIHLILATQRPSVNVITGLIKANVPSRIAFTVTSQVDSRTILDQMGAESLLGRGDMLYWANGAMYATRIQGMLVETDEIDNVVRHIRLTLLPEDWEPNIPDTGTIATGGADLGNFVGGMGLPE